MSVSSSSKDIPRVSMSLPSCSRSIISLYSFSVMLPSAKSSSALLIFLDLASFADKALLTAMYLSKSILLLTVMLPNISSLILSNFNLAKAPAPFMFCNLAETFSRPAFSNILFRGNWKSPNALTKFLTFVFIDFNPGTLNSSLINS